MQNRHVEMVMFDEYEAYLKKYQKIYGLKTVVLYQNGMFFELYGVDNDKEKVGCVREVAEILNIQLTRRDKSILENNRVNFLMAGFPINSIDRYITMLTEENAFVTVVVEQVTPAPKPQRAVTNIVGPSTNLKYLSGKKENTNNNYLLSIYLESEGTKVHQVKTINMLTIGLCAIDVSTGQTLAYQVFNTIEDNNLALDETYRTIQTLQPREVMITSRNLQMTENDLVAQLDLSNCLVHCYLNEVPTEYYKLSYQNEFLKTVFPKTGLLTAIEFLDLEQMPTAVVSFMSLLKFCYNQNETIINEIDRPLIWHSPNHLILDNNCINQLNLISKDNRREGNVFNLIDHTSTSMGRRFLKQQLLMPLISVKEINQRYDYIEALIQPIDETQIVKNAGKVKKMASHEKYYLFQKYEPYLNQINDIERYQRKICLGMLQPAEFSQLHASYEQIAELIQLLQQESNPILKTLVTSNLVINFQQYMMDYQKIVDLNEIGKYNLGNITASFFKSGYNAEIDQLQTQIVNTEQFFKSLCLTMGTYITKGGEGVVYYSTTAGEYLIELTNARYETFKSICLSPMTIVVGKLKSVVDPKLFQVRKSPNGRSCKVTSPQIQSMSEILTQNQEALLNKVVEVYRVFLSDMHLRYQSVMKDLIRVVSMFDFYKSNAKTAMLYNYCRPEIDQDSEITASYVSVSQIRHPLIERIQQTQTYVPQDIELRHQQRGMILYGLNSAGKSSLMKAIGILIILAQCGMYVSATQFKYHPYKTLLTRIMSNDNLFKGLSSFAVEMGELRGILKRADAYSMVLGDEICHSTETQSALSLVASAVITLSRANANFLFTTHLHQLSAVNQVTSLDNVKMCHLKVKYDEKLGELVYDRRLAEGPGDPIYGLLVAQAMGLDRTFIDLANEIRKTIMNVPELVPIKKSRYNTDVYMNHCGIPTCENQAVDTHHIKFQSMADDKGFISNLQKNHKSNLIPLCKACHMKVHNQQVGEYKYVINGYVMTIDGLKLDYETVLNTKQTSDIDPAIDQCVNLFKTDAKHHVGFRIEPQVEPTKVKIGLKSKK